MQYVRISPFIQRLNPPEYASPSVLHVTYYGKGGSPPGGKAKRRVYILSFKFACRIHTKLYINVITPSRASGPVRCPAAATGWPPFVPKWSPARANLAMPTSGSRSSCSLSIELAFRADPEPCDCLRLTSQIVRSLRTSQRLVCRIRVYDGTYPL